MYIKENIKRLKCFYDFSLRKLSNLTQVSLATLSDTVNGINQEDKILLKTLINLTSCFQITLEEFVLTKLNEGNNRHCIMLLKNKELFLRDNLMYLADRKGISIRKLAEEASVSKTSLFYLKDKKILEENMRIGTIVKLASYFNLTLDELVFEDLSKKEKKVGNIAHFW